MAFSFPALLLIIASALLLLIVGPYVYIANWNKNKLLQSTAESQIAQTQLGPVEYDLRGEGPVVLHFHGGNVAHNGWFLFEHLVENGYSLLTPSRPGYLGTSITEQNQSPAGQADLVAALLDTLNIQPVAVVGASAGGPGALQFALRHPDRTQRLVLVSANTQRTPLSEEQRNNPLAKMIMNKRSQNLTYFLVHRGMTKLPALTLKDLAKTETTLGEARSQELIEQILDDPEQLNNLHRMADAMVPAKPRFDGVMNDLRNQEEMERFPLENIQASTLIIHSRYDADIPYDNATFVHETIPQSELMTVDQFGHMLWFGDPEITKSYQQRIQDFLGE